MSFKKKPFESRYESVKKESYKDRVKAAVVKEEAKKEERVSDVGPSIAKIDKERKDTRRLFR